MRLFLDCEFNGMNGGLISLALVSEDATREFYEVVDCDEVIDPWVSQNVLPFLQKDAISYAEMQTGLKKFLGQFPSVTIIANFPDDFKHLSQALITGPGEWMMVQPFKMEIDDAVSSKASEVLHNALHDARAARVSWLKNNGYL